LKRLSRSQKRTWPELICPERRVTTTVANATNGAKRGRNQ
jgi:hypothetical protein